MVQPLACLTMVRDDHFFIQKWVDHYGAQLGRENLYVINHGRDAETSRIIEGCNEIGIPGDPDKRFNVKRWKMLNAITASLHAYYRHVITTDVDEYVVVDPALGHDLLGFFATRKTGQVITPFGLEVVHRPDLEPEALSGEVLGPRRHVQIAPYYAKPCVVSGPCKLSRGGHYSDFPKLNMPEGLYLFHLKFCDLPLYIATMDKRNAMTTSLNVASAKDAMVGRKWFAQHRDDAKVWEAFDALPVQTVFDMEPTRRALIESWGPRGTTGMFEFAHPEPEALYLLPDRFTGAL